jgi:hypothetical protein
MNAYILAHAPFFLPAQIAGFRAAYPGCDITVVAAKGSANRLAAGGDIRVVQSPAQGLLPMLEWVFERAADGPAVFVEYDVVPVRPLVGNWMNQRGIQERGQMSPMGGLWPAAFGWERKEQFRPEFFRTLKQPFTSDWTPVIQDRAEVRGGMPLCAGPNDHRMIGDAFLHYVNGTARLTPERISCFAECLAMHGITWSLSSPLIQAEAQGPGAELKALLGYVGITATPSCPCNQRAKVMNERGCDWCEENIDTISGWLEEEAKKRNLPYMHAAGRMLIRLAIRRARKKGNGSI